MATAKAAIQTLIEDNMCENSQKMGKILLNELKSSLKSPLIRAIEGRGLLVAIKFHDYGPDFLRHLRNHGVLTLATNSTPNMTRLMPALTIDEETIMEVVERVKLATSDFNEEKSS